MLGSDDLLCNTVPCVRGDVWLPWEYGEVRVDAKCTKSFAMYATFSFEELVVLLWHRVVDKLSDCMAEGVYLLAQCGSCCCLCGVVC